MDCALRSRVALLRVLKQLSFSFLLNTNESCFIQDQLNHCCQEESDFSSDSLQKTPKGTICRTNRIFASSVVSVEQLC